MNSKERNYDLVWEFRAYHYGFLRRERITDGTHIYVEKIILEQSSLRGIQVERTRNQWRGNLWRKSGDPLWENLCSKSWTSFSSPEYQYPKRTFRRRQLLVANNLKNRQPQLSPHCCLWSSCWNQGLRKTKGINKEMFEINEFLYLQ